MQFTPTVRRLRTYVVFGLLLALAILVAVPHTTAAHPAAGVPRVPAQQGDQSRPVFALPGRLRAAQDETFATYLLTNDGRLIALVGETPTVEAQITDYREMGPDTQVKIWGRFYPQGRTSDVPEVVVTSITPAAPAATPTPTPTATAVPAPFVTVRAQALNVRAGPDVGYPRVGGLTLNDTCLITGRNDSATWWRVRCPDGLTGWVSGAFVLATGDTATVPVIDVPPPPPPTATPTPQPPVSFSNWRASYFTNRDLTGGPVLVEDVERIDFNWGTGSPAPIIPPDNFSIRFERTLSFPTGLYEFVVIPDDGVRVYLDNQLIIDSWEELSARRLTAQRTLSGNHTLRVEYFEAYGQAQIQFTYDLVRSTTDWTVAYYNNPNLSGSPVLTRGEPRSDYPIDQNWGSGSPVPGTIGADTWSGRWVGQFSFEGGDYVFTANVDDGVRVYIDGIRVIDAWYDGYKQVSNTFYGIGRGRHEIVVEYYERQGGAALRVWWSRTNTTDGDGGGGRSRDE